MEQCVTDLASLSLKDWKRREQMLGIQWAKYLNFKHPVFRHMLFRQCLGYEWNILSGCFVESSCFATGNIGIAQI